MMIVESRLRTVPDVPTMRRPAAWTERALCASHPDPDLWFPEVGDVDGFQRAAEICRRCPVLEQCRAAAVNEPHGVWAGEMHHPLLDSPQGATDVHRVPESPPVAMCSARLHERTRANVYAIREGNVVRFGCRDCDAQEAA